MLLEQYSFYHHVIIYLRSYFASTIILYTYTLAYYATKHPKFLVDADLPLAKDATRGF